MSYRLFITAEAREQLRALPDEIRRNIGYRIQLLQNEFTGDIKKLEGPNHRYRMRVGIHRVLFRIDGDALEVYAVKQRRDAYE